MPTSKKELFNLALGKVTRKRISSPSEESNEANYCREYFEAVLDEVLTEHSWTGCVDTKKLVKLDGDPPHGFGNRFQLPNDLVRAIQYYYDDTRQSFDFEWERRRKEIWTDQSTIYVKYVFRPDSIEELPPTVISCLVMKLAYRLAFVLSTDSKREQQILQEYETLVLPRAKAIDSMENRFLEFEENPWVETMLNPSL